MSVLFWKGGGIMQPYFRYPPQPQHPMQPFQVNRHMGGAQLQASSVDRFLGAMGSGGFSGGTNVFTMLNNVQKVLKVAETMGPMIKQYGPAMKNLPSIMSALKDFQSGATQKNEAGKETDATNKTDKKENKKEKQNLNEKKKNQEAKNDKKGAAVAESNPKNILLKTQEKPSSVTRPVPSRPKANIPKGYHLSGPKLYV
jgi:hypothetical protein